MIYSKSNLLENRLEFITCYRDKRISEEGIELFYGEPPFFKNAFVFDEKAIPQVPAHFEMHIPDWVRIGEAVLKKNNWQKKDAMKYVWLNGTTDQWATNPSIQIVKIKNKKDLPLFCKTQSMGFNEKPIEKDPWYAYICNSAGRNFGKGKSHFYVALLNDVPIGITLSFYHKNLAGIYSVTTIKEYRGMGASTSLMKKVVDDALKAEMKGITLQTMIGSYAEGFYEKLGFEDSFSMHIYEQQK